MRHRSNSTGVAVICLSTILTIMICLSPISYAEADLPATSPSSGLQLYLGGGAAFPQGDLKEATKTAWMITAGAALMRKDLIEGDLFISYKYFSTKDHPLMDYYDIYFDNFQITGIYGELRMATTRTGSCIPYFLMDAGISILSNVPDLEDINVDLNRVTMLIGFGGGFEFHVSRHYSIWMDGKYFVTSFHGELTSWNNYGFNVDCNHLTAQAGIKYSLGE